MTVNSVDIRSAIGSVPPIGVYEKTLPRFLNWRSLAESVCRCGYDFIELSIDCSEERLCRLKSNGLERRKIRAVFERCGIPITNLNLSALREYELGSQEADRRRRGVELLDETIDFCADLGGRCVLVPGYFSFATPTTEGGRDRFVAALVHAADKAARQGIVIAIENVDGKDVTNITHARSLIKDINSPCVGLYPDVGNLCANGNDACKELRAAHGLIFGIHLKDARRNIFRGVGFGDGIVPFETVVATLHDIDFWGPYVVEMWNINHPDAERIAIAAHRWARYLLDTIYMPYTGNRS